MGKRLELHEILCEFINITESNGDRHVYFNAPESASMKYPAIRYSRKPPSTKHANNAVYNSMNVYEVIVIDRDPDSELFDKVRQLQYCSSNSCYTADNLNHEVFTLYY